MSCLNVRNLFGPSLNVIVESRPRRLSAIIYAASCSFSLIARTIAVVVSAAVAPSTQSTPSVRVTVGPPVIDKSNIIVLLAG